MTETRLLRQLEFIIEVDRLKTILRRSYLMDGSRLENSAEHSWYFALAAMILSEHARETIDVSRVLKMALIHDIVEIDAGDTYIYDTVGATDKADRERLAADRLFGLLPSDQRDEFRTIWEEFEKGETAEARFAASIDRLLPLLHNYHTQGKSWHEHGVAASQVFARNAHIANGSEALGAFAHSLIEQAVVEGYLPRK